MNTCILTLLLVSSLCVFSAEAWYCTGNTLMCTNLERLQGTCPCRDFQACPANPCACNVATCCRTECVGNTCTANTCLSGTPPTACMMSSCAAQCRNNQCGTAVSCGVTTLC